MKLYVQDPDSAVDKLQESKPPFQLLPDCNKHFFQGRDSLNANRRAECRGAFLS